MTFKVVGLSDLELHTRLNHPCSWIDQSKMTPGKPCYIDHTCITSPCILRVMSTYELLRHIVLGVYEQYVMYYMRLSYTGSDSQTGHISHACGNWKVEVTQTFHGRDPF